MSARSGTSTYELLAELPLTIDSYELEGLEAKVSSEFERKSTVIRMRGAGEEGLGEDVTYDAVDHDILQAAGPSLALAGTYTLASNLSCPQNQTAVTINAPVAGQIILDLAGFTLQPTGGLNDAIDVANPTGSKIVIRNGRLSGFWVGVEVNQQGYQTGGYVKNIHIENMTFYGVRFRSVVFVQVNSSSVTGCSFLTAPAMSPAQYGIQDYYTQTGNVYSDDTFDGIGQYRSTCSVLCQYCHSVRPF